MRTFHALLTLSLATLPMSLAACDTCGVLPPSSGRVSDTEMRSPVRTIDDVALLASYLTGSFSSAEQARQDPDGYFDIRLSCVPIWTDRADGPWLYIEQAAATALERPYRQRVYHLVDEGNGVLRSDVFTLPGDPIEWAGAWREPESFGSLTPASLDKREGCSVYLERQGEAFVGGTLGKGCSSALGEASYATSEMTLLPDALVTLDRGWTDADEQAWGAVGEGYVFQRVPMPE